MAATVFDENAWVGTEDAGAGIGAALRGGGRACPYGGTS